MNKQLMTKLNETSSEEILSVIEAAKDYAMYKGIGMRDLSLTKDARVHLPFCLIPTEFPEEWFYYVYNLQTSMNLILHKVAYSKEIIQECLKNSIEADEFIQNIFNIFEKVFDSQQMSLGLFRSDYLLSCNEIGEIDGIKQVENNTMAVGLGAVSSMLRDLYSLILEKLGLKDFSSHLPENKSWEEMAKAMVSAWHVYENKCAIILFVVEESTFNIYDQRLLEYKIVELDSQIEVVRCTFKDLRTCLVLREKKLYVNDKEVAVVYFRVGYAPKHYEPEDWTTRLLIEQSTAIKCPSVGLHLAGTKQVQLFLAQEGVLEKFVEPAIAEKLRKVFANQYSLNMDNGSEIISEAISHPDVFVLKPEREGGGNNLYNSDIKTFLEREDPEKRKSYILMERVTPPATQNCIIRNDRDPVHCLIHSELGIFGVILGNGDSIYTNDAVGHLLRSKPVGVNEGGVASGSGALAYPYFV